MSPAEPLEAIRTGLAPVLAEVADTLRAHGSLAATAYVLPDWTGRSLTTVSLAANSPPNREQSLARVRATATTLQAVAVVWAQDAWATDQGGERSLVVAIEVQTPTGAWYRLQAPVWDDDHGEAGIDPHAAIADLRPASDRRPLFGVAFTP